MRRLTEVRMVNWHSVQDTTVPILGSCLVFGENAAGKTTLIDAIQYGMLADQRKAQFNRAAGAKRRDLAGYLRWLSNADEQDRERAGADEYLRAACTSYLLLRFTDTENPREDHVFGLAMDITEGNTITQRQFYVPGRDLQSLLIVHVAEDGTRTPFPADAAVARIREIENARVFPSATQYRLAIQLALGELPESYFRLLVRALSFRQISNVREFIEQFLLEPDDVDTDALQRNVHNYQDLKAQSERAIERVDALETIEEARQRVEAAQAELFKVQYSRRRAARELAEDSLRAAMAAEGAAMERLEDLNREIGDLGYEKDSLASERDSLVVQRAGNKAGAEVSSLESQLGLIEDKLQQARNSRARMLEMVRAMRSAFERATSTDLHTLRAARPHWFPNDPFTDRDRRDRAHTFLHEDALDFRRGRSWFSAANDAEDVYREALRRARKEFVDVQGAIDELHAERDQLLQGQQAYPLAVRAFQHMLENKLGLEGDVVRPLCERLEITDPRWTNAVEAMLGRRRFDFVVTETEHDRVRRFFDRYKAGYSLPGKREPVELNDVRFINMRGVRNDRRGAKDGSLALRVEANDTDSRQYMEWLLGEVICVEDSSELVQHRRSVTPDVTVHQGHGTFRMNPEQYRRHWVGQAARERRLKEIGEELVLFVDERAILERAVGLLEPLHSGFREVVSDFTAYKELSEVAEEEPSLAERAGSIRRQISELNEHPELKQIDTRLAEVRSRVGKVEAAVAEKNKLRGGEERTIKVAREQQDVLRKEVLRAGEELQRFEQAMRQDLLEVFVAHYRARREEDISLQGLLNNYEKAESDRSTKLSNAQTTYAMAQSEYNVRFDTPAGAPEDFDRYRRELVRWRDTRLPEYRDRIVAAQERARKQLVEDYLRKLWSRFESLDEQFRSINLALKHTAFRWGRYEFKKWVHEQYGQLYELAKLVSTTGSDSLFVQTDTGDRSRLYNDLEALADRILNAQESELQREVDVLRDYRKFFDFDLVLKMGNGKERSFRKLSLTGSGGENQVPFYIAVLAAMYQVYRSRRPENGPTCGLVILDEAFNNMDASNVERIMAFAHSLRLQTVIVTPGRENVQIIGPRVECAVLVNRDTSRHDSVPTFHTFGREKVIELIAGIDEPEAQAVATSA